MKWLKTFLWVILAGFVAGTLSIITGIPESASFLGVVLGGLTMMWCIDRYDLL